MYIILRIIKKMSEEDSKYYGSNKERSHDQQLYRNELSFNIKKDGSKKEISENLLESSIEDSKNTILYIISKYWYNQISAKEITSKEEWIKFLKKEIEKFWELSEEVLELLIEKGEIKFVIDHLTQFGTLTIKTAKIMLQHWYLNELYKDLSEDGSEWSSWNFKRPRKISIGGKRSYTIDGQPRLDNEVAKYFVWDNIWRLSYILQYFENLNISFAMSLIEDSYSAWNKVIDNIEIFESWYVCQIFQAYIEKYSKTESMEHILLSIPNCKNLDNKTAHLLWSLNGNSKYDVIFNLESFDKLDNELFKKMLIKSKSDVSQLDMDEDAVMHQLTKNIHKFSWLDNEVKKELINLWYEEIVNKNIKSFE